MTEATLTGCTFTGGKGVSRPYDSYNGSVSYAGNGNGKDTPTKLTVTNCSFTNNHTGIRLGIYSKYEISITDSDFTGCDYGILQFEDMRGLGADLTLVVQGTTFSMNKHGMLLTATNYKNVAKNNIGSRDVTIQGCTFSQNSVTETAKIDGNASNAGGNSGAGIFYNLIFGDPAATSEYKDKLTISECTFTENTAGRSGGAICFQTAGMTATKISDSCFTKNGDNGDASALYVNGWAKELTIENSSFNENAASSAAINVTGGTINMRDCEIKNNDSDGFMYYASSYDAGNVTLEGVTISENNGCGIDGAFTQLIIQDYQDKKSSITKNGNSGIFSTEGAVTVKGHTEITGNIAVASSPVTPGVGGGISSAYSYYSVPSLTIQDNAVITGNAAPYAGGIYMEKGSLTMGDGVVFCNNTADSGGADIWYTEDVTAVQLPDAAGMNQEYAADGEHQKITGWYYDYDSRYADADPKTPYDYTKHIGTGDVLLVAAYTPVTKYDVTFDLNYEGALEATVQKVEDGQTAAEPDPAPTRDGYAFLGWYTAEDGGTVYDFDSTVTADTKLYAHWAKEYAVTYDLNEGAGAENEDYSPHKVKDGDSLTIAAAPTKDGYTFAGWSDGSEIYEAGKAVAVTGDLTLTAQWRQNSGGTTYYTLHYESNGGTAYRNESYAYNTTVKLDKVPVREGYQFTGWYADKELAEKITSVKMTGNKAVYAGWRQSVVPDTLNGDDHFAYVVGYPDGTVQPQGNITRAEMATVFFRLLKPEVRDGNLSSTNSFDDVNEGIWYNQAVSTMAKLGIVKGRTADTFDPTAPITRAELAAICARFDTGLTDGDSNFTDISGHWAEAEIERAASLGWLTGYEDGTFRPDSYITRAEAMTMINRVLCRIPGSEDDLLPEMHAWPDNQPDAWYYLAVQEATNSHAFRHQGEIHEHWTALAADPDWTKYQD